MWPTNLLNQFVLQLTIIARGRIAPDQIAYIVSNFYRLAFIGLDCVAGDRLGFFHIPGPKLFRNDEGGIHISYSECHTPTYHILGKFAQDSCTGDPQSAKLFSRPSPYLQARHCILDRLRIGQMVSDFEIENRPRVYTDCIRFVENSFLSMSLPAT